MGVRGGGTGIWTSALFIGQFLCPLAILALADATTGLPSALLVIGAATLLLAVRLFYRQDAVRLSARVDQTLSP